MKLRRREFVQAGLSAAGLLAVEAAGNPALAASRQKNNPALAGGGFRLGMVTYNVGKDWDISTIIKNCEQTGFAAVELRTTHKHGVEPALGKEQREEVKKRFADSKVRLLSLGTVCEFHAPDQAVVRKNVDECKRFIELAHDIGALGVKVRPNGIPKDVPEEKTLTQIGQSLKECGEFAKGAGVEVWVEVHGKDSQIPWRMKQMMEVADHPQVGICWNSNPEDVEGGSVKKNFELLRPWLRSSHINELWKPEYPWRELFGLMKQAGYNRYCLMEIQETSDPVRLMHYYRALWMELCR
ncbi:MAG TPA: sugar phosphate isomerase/epimerase family protein [Blastocatellia bacterium]|nr:sugar phosphate isomerase/epimerase family protein [Blastocatellia bacterium]